MLAPVIAPLDERQRALRSIQAPDHVQPAADRPGGFRISSAAFSPGTDDSVSVDLEQSLAAVGLGVTSRYPHLDRSVALVAHTIKEYSDRGSQVSHVPLIDNPHHGEARFAGLTKSAIKRVQRALADSCEIIVSIDAVEAQRLIDLRSAAKGG